MKALISNHRAKAISTALFFIGLAIVAFRGSWWPEIMLVIGIPLAIRQLLTGRLWDMGISIVVFGGVFFFSDYNLSWNIVLPVIFIIAAIFILGREFLQGRPLTEEEQDSDLNIEIEEEEHEDDQ